MRSRFDSDQRLIVRVIECQLFRGSAGGVVRHRRRQLPSGRDVDALAREAGDAGWKHRSTQHVADDMHTSAIREVLRLLVEGANIGAIGETIEFLLIDACDSVDFESGATFLAPRTEIGVVTAMASQHQEEL